MTRRSLLSILVEQHGAAKPRGHKWAMKAVNADLSSSREFTWPFPGGRATSPQRPKPGGACPAHPGDGLCVALTPWGAASGGHKLSTVLLVSYHKAYGGDDDKVRVAHADVHAIFDIPKLARQGDLRGAALHRAYLYRADLCGADLHRAYLYRADLCGADLSGADLQSANLCGADLSGADLRGANLCGADLSGADLRGANLHRAYLYRADLSGAVNLDQAIGYTP